MRRVMGVIAAAVLAVGGASLGVSTSAVAEETATCAGPSSSDSPRIWVGEPDSSLAAAAEELQTLANDHASELSGVAYCSNYSGVEVFIKGDGSECEQVLKIQRDYAGRAQVLVRHVRFSLTDLLDEADNLKRELGDVVQGVGPDILNDGVQVRVGTTAFDAIAGKPEPGVAERIRSALENRVPIRFHSPGVWSDATRNADWPRSMVAHY